MKKRGVIATLLALGMFVLPAAALALCIAVVTGAITINGIVVSTNLPAGPGGCQGDPGWGGVVARSFTRIFPGGGDPADKPSVFLAGQGTPLNKFYVGVHVPYDPDLRRQDRLTLYFDADNSGSLNAGDFALMYDIGKDIPIASQESCDSIPGEVQMFHYSGASWGAGSLSTPGITSKFAFDYDDTDAERDIWELEIQIDAGTAGLTAPFKMGAKLYQHEFIASDSWQTWIFPAGLTAEGDPQFYFPDDGGVTPATMSAIELGSCADVVIDDISSTDPFGHNNQFYRPQAGDWVAGQLPANRRTHFYASVRFYNPSDPSDNSPVGVPNTGNVQFMVRPWGSGHFLGERVIQTATVPFDHLGQSKSLSFDWPIQQTDYTPIEAIMNSSGHTCLQVTLGGYLVNLPTGDQMDRNLTYTTLSSRVDTFFISSQTKYVTANVEGTTDYIIRSKWRNVPAAGATGWEYRITPADTFGGLKDLGKGYYLFQMHPRQDRRFQVEMQGGTMPIKSSTYTVTGQTGGSVVNPADGTAPIPITVKEGQTITIVAEGRTRVLTDSVYNGADGRSNREYYNRRFLLDPRAYDGWAHIGTLVGSFEGKSRWFVIGADGSFLVPAGATTLWLAVNDILGEYHDNTGAFTLYVFITDPHSLPTQLLTPGNPVLGQPVVANPAANLPLLDIDIFRSLPLKAYRGKQPPADNRLLVPETYLGYAVYATHSDNGGQPGGGGGGGGGGGLCRSEDAVAFATFVGLSLLGIIIIRPRSRGRHRS